MPSFDSVNYYLRPNKNIERKLLFEGLARLGRTFNIRDYQYIGFGSIWFVDFLIAHRLLGISDMVSIENTNPGFERAQFNKPFRCITIRHGDSSRLIPDLDFRGRPVVAWLDYDKPLRQSQVLEDITLLCAKAIGGSIIIVTINAHTNQLGDAASSAEDALKSINSIITNVGLEEAEKLSRIEELSRQVDVKQFAARKQALEELVGDLMPSELSPKDFQRKRFPTVLARVLFNKFDHSIRATGRIERFQPLFNFSYQDNAPMITVGGMVASESDLALMEQSKVQEEFYVTGREQFDIDVPQLTIKEKMALDRLLPEANSKELTADSIKDEYEFSIKDIHLTAYRRLYKHYPVYGEFEF